MNTEAQVFNHGMFGSLRTMEMPDGQIGFVGKDVAIALGYKNASDAIYSHVDEEDKTSSVIYGAGSNYKAKTTIINELLD